MNSSQPLFTTFSPTTNTDSNKQTTTLSNLEYRQFLQSNSKDIQQNNLNRAIYKANLMPYVKPFDSNVVQKKSYALLQQTQNRSHIKVAFPSNKSLS